jgi:sarcosine oxidase
MTYDTMVLGLGGMGSAAACELARRGRRVLGLERYTSPHDRGSSHGSSRVIRLSYYEDPAYVPLLLRAYELWRQIERETGAALLTETGGLMIGRPEAELVAGSARSAREHDLPHEILDAREIRRRYPPLRPDDDMIALFDLRAGFLRPEAAVKAHLDRAAELGAELHFEEPVLAWEPARDGVCVRTARGSYEASRLVVAPGAWAPEVLADLQLPLSVERQVLYWFDPIGGIEPFLPDRFPIFIWDEGDYTPYGFPALEGPAGGVKVSFHQAPDMQRCTPATIDRTVHEAEVAALRRVLERRVPALNGRLLRAVTCMYTNTPDRHFIVTAHPQHPQVIIACGFSGHGFKFCSVVGEIVADLAERGETRHPIGLFNLRRLSGAPAASPVQEP